MAYITPGRVVYPNLKRQPTKYEQRVYKSIKNIPRGKVTTYGALAKVLKSSPRAVGGALKRNPFAPQVPCHRVIAASLELGGFSGSWGVSCESVQKKKRLLAEEGVKFTDDGKIVNKKCVLGPTELARLIDE